MNTNTALYLSNAGSPALSPAQIAGNIQLHVRKWFALQHLKYQVRKERRELAELPDYLLEDMGIDRSDALLEAQRGFNDIPLTRINRR